MGRHSDDCRGANSTEGSIDTVWLDALVSHWMAVVQVDVAGRTPFNGSIVCAVKE